MPSYWIRRETRHSGAARGNASYSASYFSDDVLLAALYEGNALDCALYAAAAEDGKRPGQAPAAGGARLCLFRAVPARGGGAAAAAGVLSVARWMVGANPRATFRRRRGTRRAHLPSDSQSALRGDARRPSTRRAVRSVSSSVFTASRRSSRCFFRRAQSSRLC